MNLPALQRSLADVVAEYDHKVATLRDAIAVFEKAGQDMSLAAAVGGSYGGSINTGHVTERELSQRLLCSAWKHVYDGLNIEAIASASDRKRFDRELQNPPPFTLDNIRATFGHYVADPRGNILRGLAEVFCALDPFYKSHDRVKIGVAGLPKRIILENVASYGGWGRERLQDILSAIAAYERKPLADWQDVSALISDGRALLESRGVELRRFQNGNGHLHFSPETLRSINLALAEYYGEVLPDATEERPDAPRESRAVAKDLQFYPTPPTLAREIVDDLFRLEGQMVLEPSCGEGVFLDVLREKGARCIGIEVHPDRVAACRAKGHRVTHANFLEVPPSSSFDRVVMNPPFYGKHYAKHVKHALLFLKPGGVLTAILPVTARYDHGLLDGRWEDLPVGAFAASGTNINTTVLTMCREVM